MNNMNDNKFGSIGTGSGTIGTHTTQFGSTDRGTTGVNSGTGQMGTGDTSWSTSSDLGTTKSTTGLNSVLEKVGLDVDMLKNKFNNIDMTGVKDKVRNADVKGQVDKARTYANANPGKVLGGLAALVIGAGLLRGRSARSY
jgi:hypothetical protein